MEVVDVVAKNGVVMHYQVVDGKKKRISKDAAENLRSSKVPAKAKPKSPTKVPSKAKPKSPTKVPSKTKPKSPTKAKSPTKVPVKAKPKASSKVPSKTKTKSSTKTKTSTKVPSKAKAKVTLWEFPLDSPPSMKSTEELEEVSPSKIAPELRRYIEMDTAKSQELLDIMDNRKLDTEIPTKINVPSIWIEELDDIFKTPDLSEEEKYAMRWWPMVGLQHHEKPQIEAVRKKLANLQKKDKYPWQVYLIMMLGYGQGPRMLSFYRGGKMYELISNLPGENYIKDVKLLHSLGFQNPLVEVEATFPGGKTKKAYFIETQNWDDESKNFNKQHFAYSVPGNVTLLLQMTRDHSKIVEAMTMRKILFDKGYECAYDQSFVNSIFPLTNGKIGLSCGLEAVKKYAGLPYTTFNVLIHQIHSALTDYIHAKWERKEGPMKGTEEEQKLLREIKDLPKPELRPTKPEDYKIIKSLEKFGWKLKDQKPIKESWKTWKTYSRWRDPFVFVKGKTTAILRSRMTKSQLKLLNQASSMNLTPEIVAEGSSYYLVPYFQRPKKYTQETVFSILDGLWKLLNKGICLGYILLADVTFNSKGQALFTDFTTVRTIKQDAITEEMTDYVFWLGRELDGPYGIHPKIVFDWTKKKGRELQKLVQQRIHELEEEGRETYNPSIFWDFQPY